MSDAPPKKARRWWRTALEIAVLVAIFFAVRAYQTRDTASGPAPTLRATTVAGAPFDLAGAEGPVLVHFWATWCGVCQAEEGNIEGLREDHRVITIASQSGTNEDVARYMAEHDVHFDTIVDPSGSLAHAWGVHAFPTSFVVEGGQIHASEVGYTTSLGLRLRLWLAAR
ncbi:MAG: protein disulfide oxidoreductase [Sandaracinaceae bacterium]